MPTTEQKRKLLKAKIAVALQDELGRVPKLDFAHFSVTLGWLKTGRTSPMAALALDGCTSAGGCRKNLSMARNHADIDKFRFPLVEPPNTWKSPTANGQSRA
jgi:hypothetical protein